MRKKKEFRNHPSLSACIKKIVKGERSCTTRVLNAAHFGNGAQKNV